MDNATITLVSVLIGVVIGVVLPMFVTSANANVHKAVVAVMSILAVMGALATGGAVVVPAFFIALILGYTAALAANTNAAMIELRTRMS